MRKPYRFEQDYRRMGRLTATFVAEEASVASLMGKTVYFGEALGKHSEVWADIGEDNLRVLTDDQDFIARAVEYGLVPTGHNPLDYFEEEAEEES